jgi:LCP family protein required for cell wall assembly
MHTLLLVGQDQFSPYLGRSDALLLVFYHPRLAKASLVSIPPDLFGYLPGYTMQRLSSAYAAGGIRLLTGAVEYNLGVRPDDWLVANMDDFILFIDELGGVTVPVMQAVPNACGDFIYPGEVFMEGWLAACYARLRVGTDEASRGLRQQQLLFIVLQRLAGGGNLIRLPELYQLFNRRVRTSLTLEDLLANGSLMLRLADPKRVGFFQMGEGETEVWQISEQPPATVFLPRRPAILKLLERAIDFASKPAPFSDLVVTLEYELTVSPTPTLSPTPTPTFTETLTPTFLPTETPTPTGSATPGASPTPSVTLSPTP